jgi:hypothetical protein
MNTATITIIGHNPTNREILENKARVYRKTTDKYKTRTDAVLDAVNRLRQLAESRGIEFTATDITPISRRATKGTKYAVYCRLGTGDLVPTIAFRDSLNGESCTFIDFGLYRKVCSNGLHVATHEEQVFKQTHVRDWQLNDEQIVTIFDMACKLVEQTVQKLVSMPINIAPYQARQRILERLATNGIITESQAGTAMRYGMRYYDNQPTAFHVLNAVQESLTTNRNGQKKQTDASAKLNRALVPAIQQAMEELQLVAA